MSRYDVILANPPSVEPMDEEPCDGCSLELGNVVYGVPLLGRYLRLPVGTEFLCPKCYRAKVIAYYTTESDDRLESLPWEVELAEPCTGCNYYRCRCD